MVFVYSYVLNILWLDNFEKYIKLTFNNLSSLVYKINQIDLIFDEELTNEQRTQLDNLIFNYINLPIPEIFNVNHLISQKQEFKKSKDWQIVSNFLIYTSKKITFRTIFNKKNNDNVYYIKIIDIDNNNVLLEINDLNNETEQNLTYDLKINFLTNCEIQIKNEEGNEVILFFVAILF